MRGLRRAVPWLCLLALFAPGTIAAAPAWAHVSPAEHTPAEEELISLRAARDDDPVSSLTVGQIGTVLDLISVAGQERAHVHRSAAYSWVVPGLGHYINGATGAAIAYAATDVALAVTSLILVARLLPPSVQSRNLNYLQSSYNDIEERWRSLTPGELIPATAVGMASVLLRVTVRRMAAGNARQAGLEALRGGLIVYEPLPLASSIVSPWPATPRSCSSPGE